MIMNGKHYNTSDEESTVWILIASWIVIAVAMIAEYGLILAIETLAY